MNSFGAKMAFFTALIAVCVLFGIDVATDGVERVNGPLETSVQERATQGASPADPKPPQEPPQEEAGMKGADGGSVNQMSFINRSFLHLGDALRYVAKGFIRFTADIFSALIY